MHIKLRETTKRHFGYQKEKKASINDREQPEKQKPKRDSKKSWKIIVVKTLVSYPLPF
jgi:hypothetical protein